MKREGGHKKAGTGATAVILILIILLAFLSYFLYLQISDLNSEPIKFLENKTPENITSYSSQQQFYPNMRFLTNNIFYSIQDSCTEDKAIRMIEAFSQLDKETKLQFLQNPDSQISVTCHDGEDEIPGEYFIAGEGGPVTIINASAFYIIEKGKILLLYKTSPCDNYNVELHELLHVLGFKHSENKESTMHNTTSCSQVLTNDIIQELNRLYSIPSLPDLYLYSISAEKHGIYLDFKAEIKNQGLANSENINLELYAEEKFEEFNITGIDYGEGKILEAKNIKLPSRKTSEINFILVSGQELNKENNIANLYLQD